MATRTQRGLESRAERLQRLGRHGGDEHLASAFQRSVEDGQVRLQRTWPGLLATGLVGGIDLGVGVAALLIVQEATGSRLLGALAFTIGFIALTLARSELFTENFLVPVAAVVAHRARIRSLVRLWTGTLAMNLVGGWLFAGLIIAGFPRTHGVAIEVGRHYPEMGLGWEAFSSGLLGGAVITLMTWMERSSHSEFGRLLAVVSASFLLAAGPLNHVVVSSVEMFTALHAGAPFGYAEWGGATVWSGLANMVGGLGLVTILRLVQVGAGDIVQERRRAGETDAESR